MCRCGCGGIKLYELKESKGGGGSSCTCGGCGGSGSCCRGGCCGGGSCGCGDCGGRKEGEN